MQTQGTNFTPPPRTYTEGRHGQCQGWESRDRRISGLAGHQWSPRFIGRPRLKGVRLGGIVQDTWLLPLALHAYTYMNAHTRAHILHSHNTINKLNSNKFKRNSHISFPAWNNLLSIVILTFPGNTTQDRFSECLLDTSLSWYLLFYLSYLDIYLYFTMRKLKLRDRVAYSKSHNGQIGGTRLLGSRSALFVRSAYSYLLIPLLPPNLNFKGKTGSIRCGQHLS